MLVGKINVELNELERRANNVENFIAYSDSLVPDMFSHVHAIISNQRYVCCLILRRSKNVPWDTKNALIDTVMAGVSIIGFSDQLIEASSLWSLVDRDKVDQYIGRYFDEFRKRNR